MGRGRLLVCTLDETIAKLRRGRLRMCKLDKTIGGKGGERKTTGVHA